MNRKRFTWILTAMLLLLWLSSTAMAATGCNDVQEGRSEVPTAPMITLEEQRAGIAATYGGVVSTVCQTTAATCTTASPEAVQTEATKVTATPEITGTSTPQATKIASTKPTVKPTSSSTPSPTSSHYTPASLSSQEQYLYNAINEDRAKNGLSALTLDLELSELARTKSADMLNNKYFAHESPTLGKASVMLSNAGYKYTSVAENIARNGSVQKAHAALMSSEGHRRNILGSQWKYVGIGVVNDANGYPYVTELFVH